MQLRSLLGLVVAACGGKPSTPTQPSPAPPTEQTVPSSTATARASNSRCSSTPRAIATEQAGPGLVVVDATSVYWTNKNGGQVMSAPLDGGPPRTLAEKQHPFGIAIDATHVYWTNNRSRTGSVMRVPKQGGATAVIADAQDMPYGPVLHADALYWVTAEGGTVVRAALDGRDRKVLAKDQGYPTSIATDGRSVFWLHTKAGVEVRKVPLDGGAPITLAVERGNPQNVVVDRSRVYWTNSYRGAVMSMPIDGGPSIELVIDEHSPLELAVDEATIYWIDHARPDPARQGEGQPKRIRKAPLHGGAAFTLALARDAVGIAVDAHCVYWTEARETTGAVMTVAK